MKWKRMGTWNSDIGFNYDDLLPCTVGVDLFQCCEDIHGIVSFHTETVILLSNKFEESKIYFDVGVEAKDYYRIKDRNKHN